MRSAFLVVLVAGLAALTVHLATADGDRAFGLNVEVSDVATTMTGGDEVCQREIAVPESGEFSRIRVGVDSAAVTDVAVSVRRAGRQISAGTLGPPQVPDTFLEDVRRVAEVQPAVPGGSLVDVCFAGRGPGRTEFLGGAFAASERTFAEQGSDRLPFDLDLVFYCGCDRKMLGRVGGVLQNASVFKIAGTGEAFGAIVALLMLLGSSALCWLALREPRSGDRR